MKAITIVAFLALVAIVCADRNEFKKFKKHHGKKYRDNDHEERRYAHFKHNHDRIEKHNAENHGFTLGHNEFSDMSTDEFRERFLAEMDIPTPRALPAVTPPALTSYPTGPEAINFINYTFPARYQGACSSCWAFSSSAQVETVLKRQNASYNTRISPQYLLDCVPNYGCRGGSSSDAIRYMMVNGLVNDNNYKYNATQGVCNTTVKKMTEKIVGHYNLKPKGNETILENILASVGPTTISIEIGDPKFQFYKSGVYSNPLCDNTCSKTHHGMLLVGYGYDAILKKKYWLIKNSWGQSWGETGYGRMIRGNPLLNNNCNIGCSINYSF